MTQHPQRSADTSRSGAHRDSPLRGPHIGPFAITPFRVIVVLAYVGSIAYVIYAVLKVRDSSQIGMVMTGLGVLGFALTATSAGGAVRMWQAWKLGLQTPTILWAIFGGIAGMLAIGCFAGVLVFSLLMGA
ncbi:MAG: hypothetical protein ABI573_09530 [Chloroflexota bacterium]